MPIVHKVVGKKYKWNVVDVMPIDTVDTTTQREREQNQELINELHKPVTFKLKKIKVLYSLTCKVWSATHADIKLAKTFFFILHFCFL